MLEEELNKAGRELVKNLVANLIKDGSIATGDLVKSVSYEVIKRANDISINIIANKSLDYVDGGRRKGSMPPVENITKWVKDKGITRFDDMTDEQMGWVIAKSIKEKGIAPTRVIERTLNQTIDNLRTIIGTAYRDEVVELLNNSLK